MALYISLQAIYGRNPMRKAADIASIVGFTAMVALSIPIALLMPFSTLVLPLLLMSIWCAGFALALAVMTTVWIATNILNLAWQVTRFCASCVATWACDIGRGCTALFANNTASIPSPGTQPVNHSDTTNPRAADTESLFKALEALSIECFEPFLTTASASGYLPPPSALPKILGEAKIATYESVYAKLGGPASLEVEQLAAPVLAAASNGSN